jgi:hypothetical protein
MYAKVVVIAVTAVAAAVGGAWALGPGELGLGSTRSDNYQTVEKDPSWLGYLPAESGGADLEVGSLNKESTGGVSGRRIDLLEKKHARSVALCFAKSEAELRAICPGTRVLGQMNRDVEERWVGQLGTSAVDFLALLDLPAPTLKQADSLKS